MKIDVTKIAGYEDLAPEVKEALDKLELPDNLYVEKKLFDKTASELAEAKKKLTISKNDEDSREIQYKEELETLRNQVAQLEKDKTLASYITKYTSIGYDDKLAKDTALAMVDGDFDRVLENQKKFLQSHDNTVKTTILGGTPAPKGQAFNEVTMTLDKLRAMSVTDRLKFSKEHPEEYESLYKNQNT